MGTLSKISERGDKGGEKAVGMLSYHKTRKLTQGYFRHGGESQTRLDVSLHDSPAKNQELGEGDQAPHWLKAQSAKARRSVNGKLEWVELTALFLAVTLLRRKGGRKQPSQKTKIVRRLSPRGWVRVSTICREKGYLKRQMIWCAQEGHYLKADMRSA